MIYVVLYGRLGNNMWQISAAATVAKKLNTDFCAYIDPTYFCAEPDLCYLTDYVKQFRTTIFRKIKFVDTLPSSAIIVNECKLTEYDFKTDVDYVLKGYFDGAEESNPATQLAFGIKRNISSINKLHLFV